MEFIQYNYADNSECSSITYSEIDDSECSSITCSEIDDSDCSSITCSEIDDIPKTSFMRLSNLTPEYLPEKEVFWVIKTYIKNQHNIGKSSADMPIGLKYLGYAESIERSLKDLYPNVQFHILYRTTRQIVIRATW